MANAFSGAWTAENQLLMVKLSELSRIAHQEFEIEISVEKMLSELDYRQLVLSELSQLSHQSIDEIISWLTIADRSLNPKSNIFTKPITWVTSILVAMVVIGVFWYSSIQAPQQTASQTVNKVAGVSNSTSVSTKPQALTKAAESKQEPKQEIEKVVEQPAETVFRLHGSNTIGEKLAPMLLEGFLEQQGVKKFAWQNNAPLERVLTYYLDQKKYAIELKAHGSSTSFQGLLNSSADIGMSSRKIKDKEITALASVAGQLNKLGNEHIIGLDGLAVIVNQNNAVQQLSSQTLAKVFSGEVTNWSQIGGADLPIKLFARDQHSGTWDTFKNLVLKKYNKKLSAKAQRFESSSKLSTLVSQNEGAIGFIGLNYVMHNKALAISASKNSQAIFPTRFTIGTEDYALSRRLYFYTPTSAAKIVKDFAQYALSKQGQDIVARAGLISQNIKFEQVYAHQDAPQVYQQYAQTAQRLSLNFRFDYATQDLDNKGKRDLARLVTFMESQPNKRIVLLGFSDSIGAKLKNVALSRKRAKSVELALTSRGIPVYAVEGLGEALPIANNDSEAGRKRNRRVEVWLL